MTCYVKNTYIIKFLFEIQYPKWEFYECFLQPRANEAGGMYGRGVLVRKYQTDQEIKVGYIGLGCILKIVSVISILNF